MARINRCFAGAGTATTKTTASCGITSSIMSSPAAAPARHQHVHFSARRDRSSGSHCRRSAAPASARRWLPVAAAFLASTATLAVLPSLSPPLAVDAAAVSSLPSLPFSRRGGGGGGDKRQEGGRLQLQLRSPEVTDASSPPSPWSSSSSARRDPRRGSSSAARLGRDIPPRGGASAVAAATSMPSVEIVTSSYELVRTGGLAALWFALKRTFGTVGDGFGVALRESTTAKFLLSGAVAGIVSRTAVSPLEVVATSQMVRGGDKHMLQELAHLFRTEGVRGFFKGNAANCLKVAPTRGIQFFAFEALKQRLVEHKRGRTGDPDATLSPGERLVAGGFAGMIAASIVYPLEPVKTMLTVYPGKYSGISSAFSGILRQAGVGGLYKGLKPTLIAMFPYVGVEFMIYETSKIAVEAVLARRAAARGGERGRHDGAISVAVPVAVSLALGALAGAAAQTSAHPLDVIRKRLQVQGLNGNPVLYRSAVDCFTKVARTEGASALYKGLGPACVATIPGTGIAYITYEAMKRFMGLESV